MGAALAPLETQISFMGGPLVIILFIFGGFGKCPLLTSGIRGRCRGRTSEPRCPHRLKPPEGRAKPCIALSCWRVSHEMMLTGHVINGWVAGGGRGVPVNEGLRTHRTSGLEESTQTLWTWGSVSPRSSLPV